MLEADFTSLFKISKGLIDGNYVFYVSRQVTVKKTLGLGERFKDKKVNIHLGIYKYVLVFMLILLSPMPIFLNEIPRENVP